MAFSDAQPSVSLQSASTFANTDLYKFVEINSTGKVVIGGSTAALNVVGTLVSPTDSTNAGTVGVGLLQGIGKVRLAGSTLAAGAAIGASSDGMGIAATTDAIQVGIIVDGSSGSTGRVVSVLFSPFTNA